LTKQVLFAKKILARALPVKAERNGSGKVEKLSNNGSKVMALKTSHIPKTMTKPST